MLKTATSLLLILSTVLLSVTTPSRAQSTAVPESEVATSQSTKANAANLKQVFADETEKLKTDSTKFDPAKADRDRAKQQTSNKGWSTTKKTLVITAIAVGLAAVLFIVIKYGKDCLKSDPPDCTPGVDENCRCEVYERRIPEGQ